METNTHKDDKPIVDYMAQLARINISESERDVIGAQLSDILTYIDKLKELNVDGIEPMRGLHSNNNVFRNDKAVVSVLAEDILRNAPCVEERYLKIPKVIE